ncbi:MAG: replicative DNA helicase [Stagnimonas sp.]|nr:replicative DNA helicase [Stagnimonas sp.]
MRQLLTPKVPPHSEEAEMSVLGGMMLDTRGVFEVLDIVVEDDFYFEKHRIIFKALCALANQSRPCDFVTVSDYLRNLGKLDDVEGMPYLGQLVNDTPGAANVTEYARIVRERAVLRGLVAAGDQITELAFRPEGRNATELLDVAEQQLTQLRGRDSKSKSQYVTMQPLMEALDKKLKAAQLNPGGAQGLPTGFTRFDEMTNGLHAGDLIIVAGRPSMGKTSFAMNIAEYAALDKKLPVLVFSMEMSAEQLGIRVVSSFGRVDQQKLRTGQMDDMDWSKFSSAMGMIQEAPLFIDETGGLSPLDLRSRARRVAGRHGLSLIVVDYIQLMQVPGSENRTNEISEISRSLKSLAKELNVPIIALSQLNRSLENRDEKRPRMSDLRESGSIEQDADVIVFLFREEVYLRDKCPDELKGKAELIISKQRNGPTGTCRAAWLGQFTRFDNLDALAPLGYNDDY